MTNNIIKFSQKNIPKIKAGMFWYDDDTFSADLIADKKVKAVVELVDTSLGVVYGDIFVQAKRMLYSEALKYIKFFNEFCQMPDSLVRQVLYDKMVKIFTFRQTESFIAEFIEYKNNYTIKPNSKICMYDSFQHLKVAKSQKKIDDACIKLHKTVRSDAFSTADCLYYVWLDFWKEASPYWMTDDAMFGDNTIEEKFVYPVLAMKLPEKKGQFLDGLEKIKIDNQIAADLREADSE